MKKEKRAQAAVEMLGYAAFFMFVFVVAIAIFFQMQSQEISRAEHAYAQEMAYSFADSINTAFIAGSGFSQNVTIPHDLLGKPYTIRISNSLGAGAQETGFVYIDWQEPVRESTFSAPTVTTDYDILGSKTPFVGYSEEGFILINNSASDCTNVRMHNSAGRILFADGCPQ